MSLAMRDGHPLAVAVREGFWDANFAIEATLTTGSQGGIAFRVQDKNNYFLAAPWSSTAVRLYRVANGQISTVSTPTISTVNWNDAHDWYLRADGSDLDLAVKVGGDWEVVFYRGDSGQGVLSGGSDEGGVGLGATGESAGAVVCDEFIYGYDPEVYGGVTQVIGEDVFDAGALGVEPDYDAAGNLIDDGVYQYGYDAWNRLVSVERKAADADGEYTVVATYRYDGLGHRIRKVVTNCGDMNRTDYYYYNGNWQLLEVDQGGTPETHKAVQQFVWGSRYIDEAVCMDVDTDGDGSCTDFTDTGTNPDGGARRFFHMQDANWNVVGLREGTTIVERYDYDPYGTVRVYRGSASTGAPEQRTVTGQSLKWLSPGLPGNPVLYAGYFHDNETGLYHVRHRMLGRDRWMQRDSLGTSIAPPAAGSPGRGVRRSVSSAVFTRRDERPRGQYADGMNLYQYGRGDPCTTTDPSGLLAPCRGGTCIWPIDPPPATMGCCGGKAYDTRSQGCCGRTIYDLASHCCENGAVVDEVPIWMCTRSSDAWYGWFVDHCYVCCDGPNQTCFSKGPHNTKPGPISPESNPSGSCSETMVCPRIKRMKCENPQTDTAYNARSANCCDWAYEHLYEN
jgi:YD repeat-containing protein